MDNRNKKGKKFENTRSKKKYVHMENRKCSRIAFSHLYVCIYIKFTKCADIRLYAFRYQHYSLIVCTFVFR